MPKTINKTDQTQIIGGVFTDSAKADNAVQQLREEGIAAENIQVVVLLNDKQNESALRDAIAGRGIAESQALYYERAVREGKVLVAVHNVTEPAPVIDILDGNGAEYNPDGSRNLRDDVAGLTFGAAAGAVAGGVAGAVAGGPLGAAVGAAAGAVVGAGAGGAAGKAAEHSK
jgi:uncharacterized membrane protein